MKKLLPFCLLLTVIFTFSSSALHADENSWKKAFDKNNITIYTRPVVGSTFDEFKGITEISAPLDVIVAVIEDVKNCPLWMADCIDAKLIENVDDTEKIVYFAQELPWPVKNRDMVDQTKTTDNLENKEFIIAFKAITHSQYPPNKKFIRMTSMEGEWTLQYIDKNTTHVMYRIKADPAGSIPAMIANMTSKKIPYKTLRGLKKMAQKKQYAEMARKSSIRKRIDQLTAEGKL